MEIRILGADEVRARLDSMQREIQAADGQAVIVGTPAPYGPGIEYGRHPGGRLARRLGGSFALTDAFEAVKPRIVPDIRWALAVKWARGSSAVGLVKTMLALGNQVLALTKVYLTERVYNVPIPTTRSGKPRWRRYGHLRESYHVAAFGLGAGRGGDLRSLYSAARRVR